ncbi:molybdopterin-dependent oxidoreductase [Cytobacillus sp. Hm23]
MRVKYKTACPLNCWDSCGFEVTVENNMVVKIEGDQDHPITKGKICGRGRMLEHRANSNERVKYPLKKVNGTFQRISWEQALNEISNKLAAIKKTYGTTAVLHSHDYSNSGLLTNLDKRFFNCYGGVTELTGSICWGAGIEAQTWDFGDSYSHSPDDVFNSKNIVIWGRNVARTNMHLYANLTKAKQQGANIIVIDPMSNATAKLSNEYVSIKPGMDGLLAIGIMKEIVRLNLQDQQFIDDHTLGYSDLLNILEEKTLDELEEHTDVSKDIMTKLAHIYANEPTMTYLGLGMQRYTNGGNTIRLIDALVAISGNIGIPGGGVNFANKQVGESFDINALSLTNRRQHKRTFTMMQQAEGILLANDPPIKMVFVTCGNPVTQVPNTNRVKQAFSKVDTIVVVEQFMTDTAQMADYVLPTTTVFEEEDVYYSSMYHHYVNYGPKLVEPSGEVKSELMIWTELAKRLGFADDFAFNREQFINIGLGDLVTKGITLERLRKYDHLPLPIDHVPWSDKKFMTASGKYEFTSSQAIHKGFDGRLRIDYPLESKQKNPDLLGKYPYTLLSIHPLRSNHSQHYHLIDSMQEIKVEVSKDVAEKERLQEDDLVKVFNERGELEGRVRILKEAHRNTINIDEGQWSKFGGSVNLLTPNRISDNGMGSTLFDCVVAIEKI